MLIKKLLPKLKMIALENYKEIKKSVIIMDSNMEDMCMKVAVCKSFLDYLLSSTENAGSDIPKYLYYERPISSYYEWYVEHDYTLENDLYESINSFVMMTSEKIQHIIENPNCYTTKEHTFAAKSYKEIIQCRQENLN